MIIDNNIRGTVLYCCLFAFFVLGFLVFLAPVFTGILNIGNTLGMICCALLAALVFFHEKAAALFHANKLFRGFFIAGTAIGAVALIMLAVASVLMLKTVSDKPHNPSALIVLGCRVKNIDGNIVPSLMLSKRINAAYDYLVKYPDSVCILSGGQGSDEPISEAECMFRVLTEKGISAERLIKEDKSTSTYENIKFSKAIIDGLDINGELAVVTNEFHLCRAVRIAKEQGLEVKAVSAPTAIFLLPTYWLRDCLGVIYEYVF